MKFLLPSVIAWAVAQGLKHLFRLMGRNRRIFSGEGKSWLMPSGGMPSAHSAGVASFTTYLGLVEGVSSSLFALSFLFSLIVVYDSMRVRYSSGRQGDLLNSLLKDIKSRLSPVRVAHGHTSLEVGAGVLLGVLIGFVVFITT